MKSILQNLKEKLDSQFPHISSSHLEKILNFQWEQAYKQFSLSESTSIEVSGLGTFVTRPYKVNKEINNLQTMKDNYLEKMTSDPDNSTLQKKLQLTEDNLMFLNEKKKLIENEA